ncbi:cilia- and flagella-associated protein 54-like [Dunckerocampus dactyliophorus]|uniref:cilia- and flagella-associated protein 54-like n=1 Tax=Dunckerocampus dactyliophorus TaxID=161453 RepID=UPI002405F36C|nr:cilia- and flagella-associated protein 54-like [Dunckerocampus dactyliophorus]
MATVQLPATYYGQLDKRNPVIVSFERDISSFMTIIKRVASAPSQDNFSYAKGSTLLAEIWRNYKQRLPSTLYQQRMLQIGDFLAGSKLYQLALSQGYSLLLLQFSSTSISDIRDVDHFVSCFFPEGFESDQDIFSLKVRSMLGCAVCIFELEKRPMVLSQKGLSKLLHVLNFIRIMMQAFQPHEHLCWQIYNGTLHIYNICRYLMKVNHNSQALEYLLWASLSLEPYIHVMTAQHLPWIVTLYCAVCHCYYANQLSLQAEEFARRALGRINDLAEQEKQSGGAATQETQMAYREASIKLAALMFKRAVFETRRKPKHIITIKTKTTLKDFPNIPWPRNATERMLMGLFDSSAAQFLGICEALWDSSMRPLQARIPDEPELQEVVLELFSAGIGILSGVASTSDQKRNDHPCVPLSALTTTSTLMEIAIAGENKVPITAAVRFIKLMMQYKQPDPFAEHAQAMLQILSTVEGLSFRKAEHELALINGFNTLKSSQRKRLREDVSIERHKWCIDGLISLTETLHKAVCGSVPNAQPDAELVWDVLLFLWGKLKMVIQMDQLTNPELTHDHDKWTWCLSMLCNVAFACDLATIDCIKTAEMIHSLVLLLESAADHIKGDGEKTFSLLQGSHKELLQKVCEVVAKGLQALVKRVVTLMPQDGSAVTDTAYLLKREEGNRLDEMNDKEKDVLDVKQSRSCQSPQMCSLVIDLLLELNIVHHRASLKLIQLNSGTESDLLDKIKKNKVSKALFLTQKALLLYDRMKSKDTSEIRSLLEEACTLVEKAGIEERKLYIANNPKYTLENEGKVVREEEQESPPPPPILIYRTDHSLTFAPAPYHMEEQVCWYQLCGHAAEGINLKVRLGDCSLAGTGNFVPAVSGEWELKVEGLEPNQKYVFALAAYNSQGKLLGNSIGGTSIPLMASMPQSLLSTWAHLAQVAFQTKQYTIAKRACKELWNHYTLPDSGQQSTQDRLASTALHLKALQNSSPLLCQLFLTSIFIRIDINIQQHSLLCDSGSIRGLFVWKQEARLDECERLLVAMDLAMWLNDSSFAVQAVVSCYALLVPFVFHQIPCDPAIELLTKCLTVLKENGPHLKQKWSRNTVESLMHMIACITNYLSKALRAAKEHRKAAMVIDSGRALLQEIFDAQERLNRLSNKLVPIEDSATVKDKLKTSPQLKELYGKYRETITIEAASATTNKVLPSLTGSEDVAVLRERLFSSALKKAYEDVMHLSSHSNFIEFSALLLQRALEEGHPGLVLQWGQVIFTFLARRDEVIEASTECLETNSQCDKEESIEPTPIDSPSSQNILSQKSTTRKSQKSTTKKRKFKLRRGALLKARTARELQAVERLLSALKSVFKVQQRRLQLRKTCSEERVWRSQLNYCIAQAHLTQFECDVHHFREGSLQSRHNHLNPSSFFLANSGFLMQRHSKEQLAPKPELTFGRDFSDSDLSDDTFNKEWNKNEACDDSEGSCEEAQDTFQQLEEQKTTCRILLDSLEKAALHLRKAMVLAHRGGHWTTLQKVCHTVWEESSRITALQQTAAQLQPPFLVTSEQLHKIFTPLLVHTTDLIIDMLSRLGLWRVYDSVTEEEEEFSLCFSVPLDDCTQVDMRWVRTLVLHTLELLHDGGKWENLAHFALLFNSYTRDRYALTVTPLLILAQRKLLERINTNAGPRVPQPHHLKTEWATGQEVTYKSYAGCQVLSGWIPHPVQRPSHKNAPLVMPPTKTELIDAEIKRSWALVCVPLDVENTLHFYRQSLERVPHCLQVFRYSRSLLLLLLAHTQASFESEQCLQGEIDFNPILTATPNIQPWNLIDNNNITPDSLYNLPISPDLLPKVISTFAASTKYLQSKSQESLRVHALHEMGNLHFYDGNTRMAHTCWSKAVDAALQSSGVIDKWDGATFGGGTLQQTLKHAGIWGCLQAAVLAAKIAQYILTSDISQRTMCSLLSTHLFKCVLCCSLAHPLDDLQYASYSIGDELLPGVDLFSEHHRADLGTTVASLNFICQWLFITGYFIALLPMLALYQHLVGTVCRDVERNIESKILKIRTLAELCLFSEAIKDALQLSQGVGILLPNGRYITNEFLQPQKMFRNDKTLLDNVEACEELLNCDLSPEVSALSGSTLRLRFNLAIVQCALAVSNTVHSPPEPGLQERTFTNLSYTKDTEEHKQDQTCSEDSVLQNEKKKEGVFASEENLTPERVKYLLLEEANLLLESILKKLPSPSCSEIENLEFKLEANLLKANLYMQQGHIALSSEMAVASLLLLQDLKVPMHDHEKSRPDPSHVGSENEQDIEDGLRHEGCPRAVEASERVSGVLWLRCRVALFRCLAAQASDVATPHTAKIHDKTAQVLKQCLDDCTLLGDVNIQALLMVEGAQLKAQRGRVDESMALLQEAVSLLSGWPRLPPGSNVTLIRATLLLSRLKGTQSAKLPKLAHKLLQKQLCDFGESVVFIDGEMCISSPGPKNIYLPFLHMLNQTA